MDEAENVSDSDRDRAFANIKKAAKYYGIKLSESSWHDVGVHPQTFTAERKIKTVETRKRDERAKKRP